MKGRVNYGFDKRKKEQDRKRKAEEKRLRKLEAKNRADDTSAPPAAPPDEAGETDSA